MQDVITQAIRERQLIEFHYQGRPRLVEPHVLGITNGIKQLLGYQVGGHSSRGHLPDWRRFDLHEMQVLQRVGQSFSGPRPSPSGRHSAFDYRIEVVK